MYMHKKAFDDATEMRIEETVHELEAAKSSIQKMRENRRIEYDDQLNTDEVVEIMR